MPLEPLSAEFFEKQETAKRNTWLFVYCLVPALFTLVFGIYLLFIVVYDSFFAINSWIVEWTMSYIKEENQIDRDVYRFVLFRFRTFLTVTAITLAYLSLAGLAKLLEFYRQDLKLIEQLDATEITAESTDPRERLLFNVVEEMALAASAAQPRLFVIEDDKSINAFSVGLSNERATVVVTAGSLEHLERHELQGLIAHEFSHILNGDMRLNTRLIALLHGLELIHENGCAVYEAGHSLWDTDEASAKAVGVLLIIVGVFPLTLGYPGVAAARYIRAAISREREFLADASAVQFTRNPQGIVGVLQKASEVRGSSVAKIDLEPISHMFFTTVVHSSVELLATHPPLEERAGRFQAQQPTNSAG